MFILFQSTVSKKPTCSIILCTSDVHYHQVQKSLTKFLVIASVQQRQYVMVRWQASNAAIHSSLLSPFLYSQSSTYTSLLLLFITYTPFRKAYTGINIKVVQYPTITTAQRSIAALHSNAHIQGNRQYLLDTCSLSPSSCSKGLKRCCG